MATKPQKSPKQQRQQPETLRLRDISPSLTVTDLQASIAWYRDVLGFMVDDTWEHEGKVAGVSLKAGKVYLNLSQDDWAKGRDRVKGEGFRLYLTTGQDIDGIAAAIKARGGKLASEPTDQPWGARTFNLVDPDGYKLTVSSST
ncbi:MAG: VOC family protein [Gemmatimonadetes bacterium]|nr:VOC family protein [Gemmatimonadota bacterium]